MKYYQGTIHVSAMGSSHLMCEICGKECLGLHIREDNIRVCNSCFNKDENAEILNESGNGK